MSASHPYLASVAFLASTVLFAVALGAFALLPHPEHLRPALASFAVGLVVQSLGYRLARA